MAYQNPDYNPDWKTVHDRHAPKREQAQAETSRLAGAGQMYTPAYDEARADLDWHSSACYAALFSQHATVQDCARWMMATLFRPDLFDSGNPLTHLDVDALRTIDEAQTVLTRIVKEAQEAKDQKLRSLPIAQPEGLTAFSDSASPGLTRTWRTFSSAELYPEGYGERATALVVVDQRDDGLHVCLGQDLNFPGATASQCFPHFAAAFYREVNALHAPPAPAGKGLAAWFRCLRGQGAPVAFSAERFHFYLHIMPHTGLRECFDRVIMRFEGGEFREESWVTYKSLPVVIKSARDYLDNLDGSGRPAHQRRMIEAPGQRST